MRVNGGLSLAESYKAERCVMEDGRSVSLPLHSDPSLAPVQTPKEVERQTLAMPGGVGEFLHI